MKQNYNFSDLLKNFPKREYIVIFKGYKTQKIGESASYISLEYMNKLCPIGYIYIEVF